MLVFIGYGGIEAGHVAKKLEDFLKVETRIETFLAHPQSRTLTASSSGYEAEINQKLLDCNVAVFVCHKNSPRSTPMKNEIDFLSQRNSEKKIVLFSSSDNCIPLVIRKKLWHPLHFPSEKPEESFCRLVNEIYRCYVENQESSSLVAETSELVRQ